MAEQRFLEISLERNGSDVPWGFRLTENSRFPTVVRVNPNGVAANVIQVGDLILKIGQHFTEGRSYADILQLIKQAGNVMTLVVDRGGSQHSSLWSSTASGQDSITSPTDGGRPMFGQGGLRSTDGGDPKPFSYTSAPDQLAEELRMRHDAMRKERKQNLANTTAARSRFADGSQQQRYYGNKAAMAALPQFTMSDPKDYTQSDVYRLLDKEMECAEKEMRNLEVSNFASPSQGALSNFGNQTRASEPNAYAGYKDEPSVRFDENVTSFGGMNEVDDFDNPTGEVGNYPQKSIRYLGRNIPSKSFRMLQSLMGDEEGYDEQPTVRFDENVTSFGGISEEDDFDNPTGEVGKYPQKSIRYLGRNIPSKSFKMLQSLMGDEDGHDGQTKSPFPGSVEPAKPSMRSVKSRAAQRKQAGGGGSVTRITLEDSRSSSTVTPTSPHSDGFQTHQEAFHHSDERRTSFTDF